MLRFMAFCWNAHDASQAQAARLLLQRCKSRVNSRWRCASMSAGFTVLYAGARDGDSNVHCTPDETGIVIGEIFERTATLQADTPPGTARLDATAWERIFATRGRELPRTYWGAYVALLHDARAHNTWVFRSPMGELPCFNTAFRDVRIYFSRMEDCAELRLLSLTVNWSFVTAHVALGMPCTNETGIKEVTALAGGECIESWPGGSARHFYWHPCDLAANGARGSMREAVEELRRTVKACVAARASLHKAVLHRFSGGLDSSMVFAALRAPPRQWEVAAVHYYYSRGAFGDERRFARAVAHHLQGDLIEFERNPLADLRTVQRIRRTAVPMLDFSDFDVYVPELQLAAQRGATAIFCGEYGDSLFSRAAVLPCVADYVAARGLDVGLFKVALDVARIERTSVWRCLEFAVRNGLKSDSQRYWRECMLQRCTDRQAAVRLMNTDAMQECRRSIDRFIHPWLQSDSAVPPAKLWMILGLTGVGLRDGAYSTPDDPPLVAPLASQPMVELCLSTPSYFNTHDGWDRALARQALAGDLPIEIVHRTAKGASNSWAKDVVARNLDFVREYLLDGLLVKEGLLDRRKVEETLPGVVAKSAAPGGGRIQEHLCTEAWLQAWAAIEHRAAA